MGKVQFSLFVINFLFYLFRFDSFKRIFERIAEENMSISKFYESREIFVTGATGSLGQVLLEKLLRSCNNEKIYVLIRSKKGMSAEERKTELFRSKNEVEFLGYVIKDGTIRPSPTKTAAVQKFPQPKTRWRKIQILSRTTRSISKIEGHAITKSSSPYFQAWRSIKNNTDASCLGFGAVLLQRADNGKYYPINYMSRKTSPQQEKYNSYELEVLAVIEGLKNFRNYLLGSKFKIITDCAAFQRTLGKKELTPKLARWSLLLDEFDYEVVHRKGSQMKHVDTLSRKAVLLITRSSDEMTTRIVSAQDTDENIKALKDSARKGKTNDYVLKNNVLYKYENGLELIEYIFIKNRTQLRQLKFVRFFYSLALPYTIKFVIEFLIYSLYLQKIFENVLLNNPEITDKVKCIEGDLTCENLGISSCHMNLITKNVSVVFHLAASVKFDESFRDSFVNNVETTKNVVEICRRMKNLVAFVHASTAYSFCDRKEVDEKIYTMARSYEEFKNIANVENNASVQITEENLLENRPSTYHLTKAITENYLNNFCRDLPIIIVRPSIVGCTWKEPFSGWNDGNSGTDYVAAIGLKGILRSMLCDEAKVFDFVPSDAVVNLMLAAAWRKSIFEDVLLKNPEITDKVKCIEGDLTRENLGISSCHMNLIMKNVSVVFHLAASVKFGESFRDSFVNNVETTKNVVEVCRQMKNLVAFVHASTAYSFCDRKEVDEKIYTMARSYEEFKNIANVENYASVQITEENLLENRPSTYHLTKAITENYLNNFCRDLPIIIVRPSIVGCTWKEPFSGWNDGNSGTDYVAAIGLKGILRSMLCDEAKVFDFVPSDAVVNLMLAAAWRKSVMPRRREDEIAVYNCTSGSINPFTTQQFFKCLNANYWKYPSENTFLYPTNIPKKSYYWNRVCIMTQHQLPAILADVLQVAIGRKPKMMKVYDKVHNNLSLLEYFCTRDWKFSTRNVRQLLERMSTKDKQCFDFDISRLNWDRYMEDYFLGIRRFVLKEDDSTIARSRKLILMKYYIILLAKCVLLFGFLYILSFYSF
ncbi:uncharacterized protein LOC111622181 [Centruroides sculpturatus]|uniref:uncharacterized protein LOC111622181 n=1 Tax=Centruroides sculpturatus TaxID=218467 RepID=UPI000C6EC522|nr:uncharacterized protein LOC111622181 [Centruroides sculpturatus]